MLLSHGALFAIFIDNGWYPNKELSQLAGPMITYLIPLLIAFSGGRLIHDLRGGIVELWGYCCITRYTNVTWCNDYGTTCWLVNEES